MKKNLWLSGSIVAILLASSSTPASAIFGLSTCEKAKKQTQSDQAVIKSLAIAQASLIKTRDAQIAKENYINWLNDPNAVSDDEVKTATLAGYRKILRSFQYLEKNQKCLKPDKYAEVLTYVESYKKVVALWTGPNAPYLSSNLIKYGDLVFYLK